MVTSLISVMKTFKAIPIKPFISNGGVGMNSMKSHKGPLIMLVILLSCLLPRHAGSASGPVIAGISGTLAHGSSITITGTGFGTKIPAAPLIWADFENATGSGQTPAAQSPSTGTILYQSALTATPPTGVPHSTYAVRGTPTTAGGVKQNVRLYANIGIPGTDKFFLFVRRYYDHARYWDSDATHMVANYKVFRPDYNDGETDFVLTYMLGGGLRVTNDGVPPNPWAQNVAPMPGFPVVQTWHREEYQMYHGTVDNTDATVKHWQDGLLLVDMTFPGLTTAKPGLWTIMDVQNYWSDANGSPPEGAYVYFDDFYLDTSWARVMLGDAATFAACTHREIQIPTAWADGSVTVQVNGGTLNSLKNTYLYVIDADGNTNTSGFPLCPDCPLPPTGLTVN